MTTTGIIGDYPFDVTYICYDETRYEEFLAVKHNRMKNNFMQLYQNMNIATMNPPEIDLIRSPIRNCRQKCRFAIKRMHELPAMNENENPERIVHCMWEEGQPIVIVENFPIASIQIYNIMPILLNIIQSKDEYQCLVHGFSSVSYLSTLSENIVITMNYDSTNSDSFLQNIDNNYICQWKTKADNLLIELMNQNIPNIQSISLIGRMRGIKIIVGNDYVYETLKLKDHRSLYYKQVEEGFSNPNSVVNQSALDWLCSIVQEFTAINTSTTTSVNTDSSTGNTTSTNEIESISLDNVIIRDTSSTTTGCSNANATTATATTTSSSVNTNSTTSNTTATASASASSNNKIDLLEMYCGNGNHTVALSG